MKYFSKKMNVDNDIIFNVASKLSYKVIKVNYAKSASKFLQNAIELKNDFVEELKNECILKIFEYGFVNDGILRIKSHTFKSTSRREFELLNKKAVISELNSIIYRYKRIEKMQNIEIDNDNNIDELEKMAYYMYNNKVYEVTKKDNNKINIDVLELTNRQKEILLMYAKTKSYQKVADMLGIGKTTVLKTIQRIRQKVEVNA